MLLRDSRGLAVGTSDRKALDAFEHAATLAHGFYNDPIAAADEALAHDPGFVMPNALKAGLLMLATDRSLDGMIEACLAAAEPHAARASARERLHLAAIRTWMRGDFAGAAAVYARITADHPRDLLALQLGHQCDFFLGRSTMLRDRVASVLPAWSGGVPGYGYVLGMHAFGLEETGDYAAAEAAGRTAVALQPRDPWAIHAVAHVCEMQGRTAEGGEWLTATATHWADDNALAYHNWWHLALFGLEHGDSAAALALYDTRIRPRPSTTVLEMIDAAALLWRLHLRGADVGGRWDELADAWESHADDAHYAFNDAHAMMAFAATGRGAAAARVLAALERSAAGQGSNAAMAREVGLPVARGIHAFAEGRYADAADALLAARPVANRFGGSHAQRDVIALTAVEAALRAGDQGLAAALAAERLALKPDSPFNRLLRERAAARLPAAA